jgi:hypothetical protein
MPMCTSLQDGADVAGTFAIQLDPSMGRLSGEYRLARKDAEVAIEVHPSGGWQPGVLNRSVRLIFFLVRIFKNWPKTYRWMASIDLGRADRPWMKSGWQRSVKK